MLQVREMVEKTLIANPYTRNSDTDLYCEIVNQFLRCGLTKEQAEIMKQIPFESVTRVRRELSHDPKYQADKEVVEIRNQRYQDLTEKYSSGRSRCQEIIDKHRQEKNKQESLPF